MGRVSREKRKEIINKIQQGRAVKDVADEYGLSSKTIYGWLGGGVEGKKSDTLEVSRLRRENEALTTLLGRLTFEKSLREKNPGSKRRS